MNEVKELTRIGRKLLNGSPLLPSRDVLQLKIIWELCIIGELVLKKI